MGMPSVVGVAIGSFNVEIRYPLPSTLTSVGFLLPVCITMVMEVTGAVSFVAQIMVLITEVVSIVGVITVGSVVVVCTVPSTITSTTDVLVLVPIVHNSRLYSAML